MRPEHGSNRGDDDDGGDDERDERIEDGAPRNEDETPGENRRKREQRVAKIVDVREPDGRIVMRRLAQDSRDTPVPHCSQDSGNDRDDAENWNRLREAVKYAPDEKAADGEQADRVEEIRGA